MATAKPAVVPERVVIGDAVLYHGDCREVLPLLPKCDCVMTDPPYGVGLAEWDRYPTQEELNAFLGISDCVVMFGAAPPHCLRALLALEPMADRVYVWHNPFTLTHSAGSFWQWQPIYVWGSNLLTGLGRDVLTFTANDSPQRYHPAQKSDRLMRVLVGAVSGQSILDPFMGSGTTGVACAQRGRAFTGIERERRYFDIACKRIAAAQAQGKLDLPKPEPKPEQVEMST
jgi:site-specific DNA-methyltransferase (adenine-specific)